VQLVGGAGTTSYQATLFSALDQIETIEYANSAFSSSYGYYANSKRLASAQTGSIQNLSYTYADAVGDIGGITDTAYSGVSSAAISGISYDGLHRLTGFTRNSQSVTFSYDSIGNMLTDTENGSTSYVYTTSAGTRLPHAIKSVNGLNYAYDTCGNMMVRGTEALMYNPENRLIALVVSNQVTTFGYDADGNRLWKQGTPTNTLQVWIGGNYEEKNGKILYHVYADNRIVYTYSSDGSITTYYVPIICIRLKSWRRPLEVYISIMNIQRMVTRVTLPARARSQLLVATPVNPLMKKLDCTTSGLVITTP